MVGKHDICATGLNSQRDADGAIGLDEDSTILALFLSKKSHLMLKRLVETGAGPFIIGITAWNRLGLSDVEVETKHTNLVAVNGKPITTYGLVKSIAFNIAGFELEISLIFVQDLTREDFILGRTFIRTHDVLLDLNQRTMTIRRPKPHLVAAVPEDAPRPNWNWQKM